jgi:hypothetical protein
MHVIAITLWNSLIMAQCNLRLGRELAIRFLTTHLLSFLQLS